MPRRRLCTFILVTGTSLSVLIAAAFVWSGFWWTGLPVGEVGVGMPSGSIGVAFRRPVFPTRAFLHYRGLSDWNNWTSEETYFALPLYAVFAAVAIPTLLVWRFWPKPPKPGHCRCGYNLTGNASGVCPECGVEVQT